MQVCPSLPYVFTDSLLIRCDAATQMESTRF